jgi:hypothetical protein
VTVVQNIPNTRLTGQQTFNFTNTAQAWNNATLVIDRTINGGLNSLTTADTLTLSVDRSTDGGTTWRPVAAITCIGGVLVTKGVTLASETLGVGVGNVGDGFRVTAVPSTPVRVAGTFTYE